MTDVSFDPEDYSPHDANDAECGACWIGYPKPCDCGGLIHAQFGDYTDEDSYYLDTCCDKCGEPE